MNSPFMEKLRSFLGFPQEPPRNDFRNPIWSSDDDDDGDELYSRHQNTNIYSDPSEIHQEISENIHRIFSSFGNMFGDMKSFFHENGISDENFNFNTIKDEPGEPENFDSNNIRNFYLKPGYHNVRHHQPKEDVDLDGKISSQEISGLLKQKEDNNKMTIIPFNGDLVPGRSFCQTIITTSVTKADGTIETRRIVKNGNEVIEETTTSTASDVSGPYNPNSDIIYPGGVIYNHLSDLMSLFKNFN